MKLWDLIKKSTQSHIVAYVVSLLIGIIVQALSLLQPKFSGELIAGVQRHVPIVRIAVSLGVLIVLGAVLTAIQQALIGVTGEKTVRQVRAQMANRFFGMDLLSREKNSPAWYSQRITNDAELVKAVPSQFLLVVQGVVLLSGSGWALLRLDPVFFLIVLIPAGCSVLFVGLAAKPIKMWQNNTQDATMQMTMTVQEAASSMRMLKAYDAVNEEKGKLQNAIRAAFTSGKKLIYLYSAVGPLTEILAQLGNIIAILYGAYLVASGQMEFTVLVMFLMYFSFFSTSTTSVVSALGQLQQAIVGDQRIEELFSIRTEPKSSHVIPISFEEAPEIRFEHVSHRYEPNHSASLTDVNFTMPSNKITALVGESGGGKTTCLSLLERFFDPSAGHVRVKGIDLSQVDITALRKSTSFVEQDPCILTGTIRDNVRLGNFHASDAQISDALKEVGLQLGEANEHAMLDCQVGESGLSLSGGQKQRIALARALVRMPKLLIMDEPTSSLDGIAEESIAELLRKNLGDATIVYSAHRLSLILEADWIVVIKDGKVLGQGQHNDLLNCCEYYKRLIDAQTHSL